MISFTISISLEQSGSSESSDDEIVHFDWHKGMILGDHRRYEIRCKLGDGTFGRVLECIDHASRVRVAVKVIRDVKRYIENARVEARILSALHGYRRECRDHEGGRGIVRLYDVFYHKDRILCLSFERLGPTLLEVIKMNNHCGFYVSDIQVVAVELLETIDFLHTVCGLTHTDIKMENIMFTGDDYSDCMDKPKRFRSVSSDNALDQGERYSRPVLLSRSSRHRSIRLIDFGNGAFERDHHSSVINTRQYRSPEVILEQQWDNKSDMWSIGCVLAEMFTGELLFPTHSNMEHLAMIEKVTEETFTRDYFSLSPSEVRSRYQSKSTGLLDWPEGCESRESFKNVNECLTLSRLLSYWRSFSELVAKLVRIDPTRRYSAKRALDCCDFFLEHISLAE